MIQYLVANGLFDKASIKFSEMHSELRNITQSYNDRPDQELAIRIERLTKTIGSIEHLLYDAYCGYLLNPEDLLKASTDARALVDASLGVRKRFLRSFTANAPEATNLLSRCNWIDAHAKVIISSALSLIENLNERDQLDVPLTLECAQWLSKGVSIALKESICIKLEQFIKTLDDNDAFFFATGAFIRLLHTENRNHETTSADERVLIAYQDIKSIYPKMARHLSNSLVKYLNDDGSISDLSLYGPYAGSHQRLLISQLSEGRLAQLRQALSDRLVRLHKTSIVNFSVAREEWGAHGRLVKLLSELPGQSALRFKARLQKLTKRVESAVRKNLQGLCEGTLPVEQIDRLIRHQNAIIHNVLFARNLGSERTRQTLDFLLDKLLAKQRKEMMVLVSDSKSERFINLSYDILMAGGNASQAAHSDNLVKAWRLYCRDLANLLTLGIPSSQSTRRHAHDIRQQAILDAIHDYICHVEQRISNFFIHHFSLNHKFIDKCGQIRDWLAEQPDILNTPLDTLRLLDLLRASQEGPRWHWHLPKQSDARKLDVAIRLSAMGKQWQTKLIKRITLPSMSDIQIIPMDLCEELKTLAIDLLQKQQLGHSKFTCQLASAIGSASEYFVKLPDSSVLTLTTIEEDSFELIPTQLEQIQLQAKIG